MGAAEHGLEIYASRVSRRVRTSIPSMVEGVSEEDEFRQMNELSLSGLSCTWTAFGTELLLKCVFPLFQAFSLSRTGRVCEVGLEYGGGITCRGSCSPSLIPHYMTRRTDMKIELYYLFIFWM